MTQARHVAACVLLLLMAAGAAAQDAAPSLRYVPVGLDLTAQPESEPGQPQTPPEVLPEAPVLKRPFGDQGTEWLTFGLAAADDIDGSRDFNAHAAWSQFIAENVEFSVELAAWYFNQEGADAVGLNPNLVFRWHLYRGEKWSVYTDAGIGVLIASDTVPDGGSNFDLMPRVGGGVTYGLNEDTRLQLGLRWHHISNARITGDESNPARDAPLLYFGVIRRF